MFEQDPYVPVPEETPVTETDTGEEEVQSGCKDLRRIRKKQTY